MNNPIEMMLDKVEWVKSPEYEHDDLPYVTHTGVLEIAGFKLNVVQLNTGLRVIPEDDFTAFFEALLK